MERISDLRSSSASYGRYRDRPMAERVAVLGTGTMGAPMARNLLKAGFRVPVWNREPLDKARVLAPSERLGRWPTRGVRCRLTGAVWLQTSMDTDVECVAGLAEDHGITFVDCPVLGTRETAKQGRLVVLASGPGDALDRAQPVFDAIASKTVRLGPEARGVSRMKLVASAWTVALVETFRCQLSRAARWAGSRSARR